MYVVGATLMKERTAKLAILSAFQSLGLTLGPAVQAAFTPLKCSSGNGQYFELDMFTAPAWFGAATGIASLILFLPGIFKEFNLTVQLNQQITAGTANKS